MLQASLSAIGPLSLGSPAQGLRSGFRQSDVANLSFLHQLSHGSDGVFDRRTGIHPVLVVEVDGLDPEPPQAALARGTNIIRLAINPAEIGIGRIADDPKFGGEDDLMPAATNRLSNQLFIGIRTVRIGGIKKG